MAGKSALMKLTWCLFLCLCTCNLYSQNCKALDSNSFFKSIRFGDQIPADLNACSKKSKTEYSYYVDFRINYDSLNQVCKKRYSDLFIFMAVPFSFSQIRINQNGQIYSVELYSFFDDNRWSNSTPLPPADFITTYNKLESLYGKPTRITEANHTDSLFIKDLGMPRVIEWECNNISVQLRVRYGAREKALNVIDVQIKNTHFELPPEEEKLSE